MKRLLVVATVLGTLAAGTVAFTQSFSVQNLGNKRGPAQPINFSHQLHAGKLGMDCLYCHYGAEKSAISNLPPVSTCMGCHKIAASDRPEVYKLPAHVKYNHKRHIKAGIACQTCHGPVQEMPVIYQYSSLKMGWCVTC